MKTRNQPALEFDFDEASRLWNANKKRMANGCYVYVCGAPLRTNEPCKRKPLKNCDRCYLHKKSQVCAE